MTEHNTEAAPLINSDMLGKLNNHSVPYFSHL